MITFICLFFPPVLSVFLYEKIQNTRLDRHDFLGLYCLDVVMVNLICFAVKRFLLHTADAVIGSLSATAGMNYLLIALVAAVLMAFVCVCVKKNVKITKEVEDEAE